MTPLSDHFTEEELEVVGAPESVKANAKWLCVNILEPIRRHFMQPIKVTSGYRPPAANAATHGVSNSFHLYQDDRCAVDIKVMNYALKEAFDEIRLKSNLPFEKIILERDHKTEAPTIIHIQAYAGRDPQPLRQAFLGETHNTAGYTQVECV